ncbi:helix-turn-helix transcriptional regulator [Amycolatopsis sp. NPDC023774]|uniref:helix-turn-helix domain-containing protein n=1 Tax=Amycolatopsis sp. NPDC023774 TaxID=3155015 RepID=UPI0033DBB94A
MTWGRSWGDFVRAKRDSTQPETLGLPSRGRRRSPGLRRSDLAARAGISVENLTRIEQGRDRNPSLRWCTPSPARSASAPPNAPTCATS